MATRPSGNRRALTDIGNLVGSLSTTCVVTKGQQQQTLQQNDADNFRKVDRPITRKFGAELARSQSLVQPTRFVVKEEKENLIVGRSSRHRKTTSPSKKRCHNHKISEQKNVLQKEQEAGEETTKKKKVERKEKNEPLSDSSLPMETADLHLDAMENLHGSCEIEMEEAESPPPNIDKSDARNPLAVVEYVDDIYTFYRRIEVLSCVPSNYMSNQNDINHKMRAILVDWLIEVHHKLDLMRETLFLAINFIDRYLSRRNVMRKFLQLVGITGMLLACKYEEICVPLLEDFIFISDRAYTRADVLEMEKSMLNTLQFNMSVPTPFIFMKRFLKAADSDNKLEMVSFYLMELCMVEYEMLKFPPSLLSAASVYTGRSLLRKSPLWNKTLVYHSTYPEDQLQECARLIEGLHQNASEGKLTAVYRKYSISKFSCVAILMRHEQMKQKQTST